METLYADPSGNRSALRARRLHRYVAGSLSKWTDARQYAVRIPTRFLRAPVPLRLPAIQEYETREAAAAWEAKRPASMRRKSGELRFRAALTLPWQSQ